MFTETGTITYRSRTYFNSNLCQYMQFANIFELVKGSILNIAHSVEIPMLRVRVKYVGKESFCQDLKDKSI